MTRPLVSVIVPVRNSAAHLEQALASIAAQSYAPTETIVVDDASPLDTASVAARFARARHRRLDPRRGPAGARNAGIEWAEGQFITFLDVDDEMTPGRLDVQVGHLLGHPGVDGCLAKQEVVIEPGVRAPKWLRDNPGHLEDGGHLPISLLVRSETVRAVGGFDESYQLSEDMDLLFRLHRAGAVMDKLDDVLVRRRIHGANLSYQSGAMQRELLRAVRAAMGR